MVDIVTGFGGLPKVVCEFPYFVKGNLWLVSRGIARLSYRLTVDYPLREVLIILFSRGKTSVPSPFLEMSILTV